ncbi:restriction endonuclease subunit S [Listeria booriae]|uniref:Restriction endonuclease subunit S n=1 Tax=Listeria booriae TaxID=1552123 RepID=A0A842CZ44_9LIST|nr:restriction endonuclease subunit S [Listeria booriae]MBC2003097.1 restriction endonuclease subunit S [Listeria booriae]
MIYIAIQAWEQRKLGELANSYSGGTPSLGKTEYYGGNIPFIRSAEINSNSTELFLTKDGLKNSSAKMVSVGDILYALYGATSGEVGLSKINGAINQAILAIQPQEGYNSQFIMQWLRLQKQKIIDKYLQGGQGNLSGAIVKDFDIEFPIYEEQKKIGNFFKQLDNTIALHQRKLDALKQMKKGFLQQMFPENGGKSPRVRFADFQEEWDQRKLEVLAVFSKGRGYTKSDLVEKGSPIILYGHLYTKYEIIINQVNTFVTMKDKSVISKGNEVIVPSSGETAKDISRASVIGTKGFILGGDLNIIKPKREINSIFLALTISNGIQQKEMIKRAQGKSIVHLNNSDLKQVKLFYPSLGEQQQIGDFFIQLERIITLYQNKLDQLNTLKRAYLKNMFI